MLCLTRKKYERILVESTPTIPDQELERIIDYIADLQERRQNEILTIPNLTARAMIKERIQEGCLRQKDTITIEVRGIERDNRVKIGVDAPRHYRIRREELDQESASS